MIEYACRSTLNMTNLYAADKGKSKYLIESRLYRRDPRYSLSVTIGDYNDLSVRKEYKRSPIVDDICESGRNEKKPSLNINVNIKHKRAKDYCWLGKFLHTFILLVIVANKRWLIITDSFVMNEKHEKRPGGILRDSLERFQTSAKFISDVMKAFSSLK